MLEYVGVSGIDDRILLVPLSSSFVVGWQYSLMQDVNGKIHDVLINVVSEEVLRRGFSTKYRGEALYDGLIYNYEATIRKDAKEFVLCDQHEEWFYPPAN